MASPTAPTISEAGITAPSFSDILDYLQTQYRAIFGADVYLGNDSQDGQFIGIIASAINDSNAAAVACYNARTPSTAQGNGLSSAVKINGMQRLVPTFSTVDVDVVGVAGTEITNGMIGDADGNKWALPAYVLIPSSGSVTVTATSAVEGTIIAAAGSVNKIKTPVYGWQTVTNPLAAVPGAPVESDAALRVRQSKSVATPSLTVMDGIVGAVSAVSGVSQVKSYENDTGTTDGNGLPAHSISLVVLGGDATAIATAIAQKKAPGCYTYGTTTINVPDTMGITQPIRFYTPTVVPISVAISLHALTGYTSAIADQIKASVAAYISGLSIGQSVMLTRLYLPANLFGASDSLTFELVSVQISKKPAAVGSSDVAIAFNELANCVVADIAISVV